MRGSDFTRILDGRRSEAKRYTFIVNTEIDELEVAVQPDWSWFKQDDPTWNAVYPTVQDKIREMIDRTTQEQRETTRSNVMQRINGVVQTLVPISTLMSVDLPELYSPNTELRGARDRRFVSATALAHACAGPSGAARRKRPNW